MNTPARTSFGVFFVCKNSSIDVKEVQREFNKYGQIESVKQSFDRIFINFKFRESAEKCLEDISNFKYGKIKQGKQWPSEDTRKENSEGSLIGSKTLKVSRESEKSIKNSRVSPQDTVSDNFATNSGQKCGFSSRHQYSDSPPPLVPCKLGMNVNIIDKRKTNFKQHYAGGPPPLLSEKDLSHCDSVPPPLLSEKDLSDCDSVPPPLLLDDGSPPLISNKNAHSIKDRTSMNIPCKIQASKISPQVYSEQYSQSAAYRRSSSSQNAVVQYNSDGPPPLHSISDGSHSSGEGTQIFLDNYIQKYGNFMLIVNLPHDTTPDEIEKVLYPHVPIWVSQPEVTKIKMNVFFCLVAFNNPEEATKTILHLDETILRGYNLFMIRLDELISFNNAPF